MDILMFDKLCKASSEGDLRDMNHRIVAEIRERQRKAARLALTAFHAGQKVQFWSKGGRRVTIQIERINDKTVSGREVTPAGLGGSWRVSASLLMAA